MTQLFSHSKVPTSIFRAYDIRGIVGEDLTAETVYALGLAIGSLAIEMKQEELVVARDARLSGPELMQAFQKGLLETGCTVIDAGITPTPVLYFATHLLDTNSGIILTGSHNPSNYNGLKIVLKGKTLAEIQIQDLYQRIITKRFHYGTGTLKKAEVINPYIDRIVEDVKLKRPLKVVIDCGNGVTGAVAPQLFKKLGCEVIELFCDVDGRFPNHHPDPSVAKNLQDLIKTVIKEKADMGLAFDGDGDRLGVVTNEGEIIWPDRQMMLFSQDILSRYPNSEIIYDVKCSRHLGDVIAKAGGRPVMWKTGHSILKAKMQEQNAPLAGEMSGHIFFKERWYGFDDGMYAGVRLLEILSQDPRSVSEVFHDLPDSVNTPELKISVPDTEKFALVSKLVATANFPNAEINTIDGLRVDFEDGWGLVRCSNTTPCLTVRFEANTEEALKRIQSQFKQQLLSIDPSLEIPF